VHRGVQALARCQVPQRVGLGYAKKWQFMQINER
jgi:hypothetical protein